MDCTVEIKEPLIGKFELLSPKLIIDNSETSNYWILDPTKPGKYSHEKFNFSFLYEPFYTGISEVFSDRKRSHLYESKNKIGNNIFKNNKINKIINETGEDPYFVITNENNSWNDACELEKFYIKTVGRRDKGLGPLTNLTDGGEGFLGRLLSKEEKIIISERMKGKGNSMFGKIKELNPFYNKTHSIKSKQIMSKHRKGTQIGKNNKNWKYEYKITNLKTNEIYFTFNLREFGKEHIINLSSLKWAFQTGKIHKEIWKVEKSIPIFNIFF